MKSITIRRPDDMHVHVRQGKMLAPLVRATARVFKRAIIMPNTNPPILTASEAVNYKANILDVAPEGFEPLMTIKIDPKTTPRHIYGATKLGIIAGKLYPDGVTTGSSSGVRDFRARSPVFDAMQEAAMVLCLHGEDPGDDVFCLDREERFLQTLDWIIDEFPNLRVVLEHLSTAAAVEFVQSHPSPMLGATVTAHHLELTLDDVIGDKLMPHHFCKPVAKRPRDRTALIEAVVRPGQTKFFLGTDSAPHDRSVKECACGAAGVFTAPLAMPLLAEIFERERALPQLEQFTSVNGAQFYGLPLNEEQITLIREEWIVPEQYDGVVPLRAGKTIQWKIRED